MFLIHVASSKIEKYKEKKISRLLFCTTDARFVKKESLVMLELEKGKRESKVIDGFNDSLVSIFEG